MSEVSVYVFVSAQDGVNVLVASVYGRRRKALYMSMRNCVSCSLVSNFGSGYVTMTATSEND